MRLRSSAGSFDRGESSIVPSVSYLNCGVVVTATRFTWVVDPG